jgi:hypothetical protein
MPIIKKNAIRKKGDKPKRKKPPKKRILQDKGRKSRTATPKEEADWKRGTAKQRAKKGK